MNKEEKDEIELNIEAKYVGRTEKEFLNNITYAECLYILDTKNNYCDKIRDLSLLKLVEIISKQQKELDKKYKAIDLIKNKLEQEIKHCESENAHLYDKCNIQLHFHKNLLNTIKQVEVEDDT